MQRDVGRAGLSTAVCLPVRPGLADAADGGLRAVGWTVDRGAFPTALGFATWSLALRERPPLLALTGGALCLAASTWPAGAAARTPPAR